jgi:hypothetical protein
MPVDINTVLAGLNHLGYENNERLSYFLYGTLLESYYNTAAGCASINGMFGLSNEDLVKIMELYSDLKETVDGVECETLYIDSNSLNPNSDIFGDLISRANDGKRYVLVLRDVENNVPAQNDIVQFALTMTGKDKLEKLNVRNSIEVFYTTSDETVLEDSLQNVTTRSLANNVLGTKIIYVFNK